MKIALVVRAAELILPIFECRPYIYGSARSKEWLLSLFWPEMSKPVSWKLLFSQPYLENTIRPLLLQCFGIIVTFWQCLSESFPRLQFLKFVFCIWTTTSVFVLYCISIWIEAGLRPLCPFRGCKQMILSCADMEKVEDINYIPGHIHWISSTGYYPGSFYLSVFGLNFVPQTYLFENANILMHWFCLRNWMFCLIFRYIPFRWQKRPLSQETKIYP